MNRIDDPSTSPGSNAVNGLRVLQVGIHTRPLIKKPGAQMLCCFGRIAPVVRYLPGSNKCGHLYAEAHESAAMRDKVVGVRHAIALNVWAAGILRIQPPVITL